MDTNEPAVVELRLKHLRVIGLESYPKPVLDLVCVRDDVDLVAPRCKTARQPVRRRAHSPLDRGVLAHNAEAQRFRAHLRNRLRLFTRVQAFWVGEFGRHLNVKATAQWSPAWCHDRRPM